MDFTEHSDTLEQALQSNESLEKEHLYFSKSMLDAYDNAIYGMDLLAIGALNRSMSLSSGFRSMLKNKNLICAGALLRLQIDTAIRFHAAWLVEEPHTFAQQILVGKQINRIKDSAGMRMTDAYLIKKLEAEHPWLPGVYKKTSAYVHLSTTHMMSALSPASEKEKSIKIKISPSDKELPESLYIEAVDAFNAATRLFLFYVRSWTVTKDNPDLFDNKKKETH